MEGEEKFVLSKKKEQTAITEKGITDRNSKENLAKRKSNKLATDHARLLNACVCVK